jgi:hypothetical protein
MNILRPKIDAILGLDTQTNMEYKMTKLPLVCYEKDLDMNLSFVWEPSKVLFCLLWLIGQSCVFDKIQILGLHLF